MAGWTIFPSYQTYALQFIQQKYGPPSQFLYATADSAYFGLPSNDDVAGMTLDQLFADLNQVMTSNFVPNVRADMAVARAYGLPLVAYEGGEGLPTAPGF